MRSPSFRLLLLAVCAASLLTLAGCGGGDPEPTPAPSPGNVPDTPATGTAGTGTAATGTAGTGTAATGTGVVEPPPEAADPVVPGPAPASELPEGIRDVTAGRRLAQAGELDEAIEILTSAGDPRAFGPLAKALLLSGEEPAAVLGRVFELYPDPTADLDSRRAHLLLLVLAEEFEEAEVVEREYLDVLREDAEYWEIIGTRRILTDDVDGAREAFERALDADEGSQTALRNLASIHRQRGDREKGLDYFEALLAAGDAGPESIVHLRGTMREAILHRELYDLGLHKLATGAPVAEAERLFVRSAEDKPDFALAWIARCELRLLEGNVAEAIAILEEGAKPVATGEGRARLLLRLATLHAKQGNVEAFVEVKKRIPPKSQAGRLLASLGEPDPAKVVNVESWRTPVPAEGSARSHALFASVFGEEESPRLESQTDVYDELASRGIRPATIANLDPKAALSSGVPVLVDRIVITDDGPRIMFVALTGYDAGLGAYFATNGDPEGPVLVPFAEADAGLFFTPGKARDAEPAADALMAMIRTASGGDVAAAAKAVPVGLNHPLADFIRAETALAASDAKAARKGADAILAAAPGAAVGRILLAEARLLEGDMPAARAEIDGVIADPAVPTDCSLLLRLRALTLLRTGEDAGLLALEDLRRKKPRYLQVYEDLSGLYLARSRYADAVEVLKDLGRRAPRLASSEGYLRTLRVAYQGIVATAATAEEILPLIRAKDRDIRKLAIRKAGGFGYQEACDLLSRFSGDPDAEVRALAVRYIGERSLTDAAESVRLGLADESSVVRGAAVRSLFLLEGKAAARRLVELLGDPVEYVRAIAATHLRDLSGRNYDFDPSAPEAERGEAVRRWKSWVKEN